MTEMTFGTAVMSLFGGFVVGCLVVIFAVIAVGIVIELQPHYHAWIERRASHRNRMKIYKDMSK